MECEQRIAASICPTNVCGLFSAADRTQSCYLRDLCKAFLIRNFARVRHEADFARMPQHLLVEVALNVNVQG